MHFNLIQTTQNPAILYGLILRICTTPTSHPLTDEGIDENDGDTQFKNGIIISLVSLLVSYNYI